MQPYDGHRTLLYGSTHSSPLTLVPPTLVSSRSEADICNLSDAALSLSVSESLQMENTSDVQIPTMMGCANPFGCGRRMAMCNSVSSHMDVGLHELLGCCSNRMSTLKMQDMEMNLQQSRLRSILVGRELISRGRGE